MPLLSPDFMHRIERLDVMSRRILVGKLKGERRSKKRGQSVEFADYRTYVHGDDLRHIDWNLYARLDRLFLRLFMEEEDLSLSILIDVTKSMNFGEAGPGEPGMTKLEFAKRIAAAMGYIGLVNYNRVGVFTFRESIAGQLMGLRGKRPVPEMLDFIDHAQEHTSPASPSPDGTGNLAATCKRFAMTQTQKGVVLLISDFFDKGELADALRYLTSDRFDVYLLQVLAPAEIDPAKAGIVGDIRLRDIEDNDLTELSITPSLITRYKANLQAYCAHLREEAVKRDMVYLMTDTTTPFDTLVLRYLRERGLVG